MTREQLFELTCPWCRGSGHDLMYISAKDIKDAAAEAKARKAVGLDGTVIFSHYSHKGEKVCCRVSVGPDNLADMSNAELLKHIIQHLDDDPDDWLKCVESSTFENTVAPSGYIYLHGLAYYQPPTGRPGPAHATNYPDGYLLDDYMLLFGLNPRCYLDQAGRGPDSARKPLHVGGH